MKSTLADVKQLFNVKAIAAAGLTPSNIPDATFGIVDSSTGLTVSPANYAALPAEFGIISKMGGKVYYSFDTIKKENIKNKVATAYKAPVNNIWKATIKGCSCIGSVLLTVNIDEASLMQRDGLTWTHRDVVAEVSPAELKCFCDCSGKNPVYENNVLTKLLVEKVNSFNSDFYTASASLETVTGVATGTAAPPTADMKKGDKYIRTGATSPGLYVYSGTAWVNVGTITGVVTDLDAFIAATKNLNTDSDVTNDGAYLSIILTGAVLATPTYHDLEVNYVYPRGVKLTPGLTVDGTGVPFTETQEVVYELGAGYDLRAEEYCNMNNYTDLNYYPRLSDGIANPDLVYQFENGVNYNTVAFEFTTDKVEKNNGDKRLFGVLLGTSVSAVFTSLKSIFGIS